MKDEECLNRQYLIYKELYADTYLYLYLYNSSVVKYIIMEIV